MREITLNQEEDAIMGKTEEVKKSSMGKDEF